MKASELKPGMAVAYRRGKARWDRPVEVSVVEVPVTGHYSFGPKTHAVISVKRFGAEGIDRVPLAHLHPLETIAAFEAEEKRRMEYDAKVRASKEQEQAMRNALTIRLQVIGFSDLDAGRIVRYDSAVEPLARLVEMAERGVAMRADLDALRGTLEVTS